MAFLDQSPPYFSNIFKKKWTFFKKKSKKKSRFFSFFFLQTYGFLQYMAPFLSPDRARDRAKGFRKVSNWVDCPTVCPACHPEIGNGTGNVTQKRYIPKSGKCFYDQGKMSADNFLIIWIDPIGLQSFIAVQRRIWSHQTRIIKCWPENIDWEHFIRLFRGYGDEISKFW